MDIHPTHPGMTSAFFDKAVHQSFCLDLVVVPTHVPGRYAVVSATKPRVTYLATRAACACSGGQQYGRCYHRARVIFDEWFDARERRERSAGGDTAA